MVHSGPSVKLLLKLGVWANFPRQVILVSKVSFNISASWADNEVFHSADTLSFAALDPVTSLS